ncbi:MAG: hypothetical protein JSV52_08520 [Candidatus Zixiibacteriota bacterium]|nr:MAG: hypothetical protein JSV52_08520 [candidate division Zixibacteria bacterium]
MKTELDLSFILRTLKTTGVVLLIGAAFGLYYLGPWPSLAFLSGGTWGMVNLIFITGLVRVTIRPEGVDTQKALGWAIIKFPLLYGAGYFLLKVPQFEPLHLLAGFSLLLLIIVLKVVGRAILGLDEKQQQNQNFGQV